MLAIYRVSRDPIVKLANQFTEYRVTIDLEFRILYYFCSVKCTPLFIHRLTLAIKVTKSLLEKKVVTTE